MTDVPTYLPATPDLWIDASQEPVPPATGNGDERATNLARSSIETVQTGDTSPPPWQDGYWRLAGAREGWRLSEAPDLMGGIVLWGVIDQDDAQSENFQRVVSFVTSGSNNARVEITAHSGDIRLVAEDNSGNLIRAIVNSYSSNPKKGAFVATFRPADREAEILWIDESVTATGSDANASLVATELAQLDIVGIGADPGGGRDVEADGFEFGISRGLPASSMSERFAMYLADKWGVRNVRTSPEGLRIDNNLPANPTIHVDAREEVDPPADGNGDRAPLNLVAHNDLRPEQGSGTNQPLYREDDGRGFSYWECAGDDQWVASHPRHTFGRFTVAGVISRDAGSGKGDVYASTSPSDVSSTFYIRCRDDTDFIFNLKNDNANGNATTVTHDNTIPCVFLASWEAGNKQAFWARNANGTSYAFRSAKSGPITFDGARISHSSFPDYIGKYYKFLHFIGLHISTETDGHEFTKYLARQFGIL